MVRPSPNLEHPLVAIACRLLVPDPDERWSFDEGAAVLLERAMLSQSQDPDLPAAVLALFHVATDLHHTHGAHRASGRMFALLGSMGPRLFPRGAPGEIADLFERVQRSPLQHSLPLAHDQAG